MQYDIKKILKDGKITIKVRRSSMLQFITFTIKQVSAGSYTFPELFSDRIIDLSEIVRIANDVGLPVEAHGLRAFPQGKGAKDFIFYATFP
ncbi:MAG: hypothetical protein QW045_02080 [Candidatus Micrarchaeaceae archaeon]